MSDRADDLIHGLLDDELDADARRDLEAELAAQPELVAETAALWRLHRTLPVASRGSDGDRFVQGVRLALRPATGRFQPRVHAEIRRSRIRARMRSLILVAVAASLAAAGLVLWTTGGPSRSGEPLVRIVACPAGIMLNGRSVDAAQALTTAVRLDDTVSAAAGPVTLVYADGTELRLGPASELQFAAWPAPELVPGRKQLRLQRGTLHARVTTQPAGRSLLVDTAQALTEVLGTEFSLAIAGEATRLELIHGSVAFTRHADRASVVVAAGQYAEARAGADLVARPLVDAVLSFDFEDGVLPAQWILGKVAPGPARAGNRFCLAGETDAAFPWTKVRLDAGPGEVLFEYEDGLELRFDYWVDERVKSLDVYPMNETRAGAFGHFITDLSVRTWAQATIVLSDLRTEQSVRLQPGDRIRQFSIQIGQQGGGILLVDNVRFIRRPAIGPPPRP